MEEVVLTLQSISPNNVDQSVSHGPNVMSNDSNKSTDTPSMNDDLRIDNKMESMDVMVNRLIEIIIEHDDQTIGFDQIHQFVNQQISQCNQGIDNLIRWLIKNWSKSRHVWFLGLLYYYNIINMEGSSQNAFELFLRASNSHYPLA